jgi:hypothetical protein
VCVLCLIFLYQEGYNSWSFSLTSTPSVVAQPFDIANHCSGLNHNVRGQAIVYGRLLDVFIQFLTAIQKLCCSRRKNMSNLSSSGVSYFLSYILKHNRSSKKPLWMFR